LHEQRFPKLWHSAVLVLSGVVIFASSLAGAITTGYGSHPLTAGQLLIAAGLVLSGAMFFAGMAFLLMWFVSRRDS
jgi:hypothetical protein